MPPLGQDTIISLWSLPQPSSRSPCFNSRPSTVHSPLSCQIMLLPVQIPLMPAHLTVKSKILMTVSITWPCSISHLITYNSPHSHYSLPACFSSNSPDTLHTTAFARLPFSLECSSQASAWLSPSSPLLKCTFSVELWATLYFLFMAFVFDTAHTPINIPYKINWLISFIVSFLWLAHQLHYVRGLFFFVLTMKCSQL